MMAESKLDVFAGMSDEKIRKIGDFVSDHVVSKTPDPAKIREVFGDNLTDIEMSGLVSVFCDFIISKKNPDHIFRIIESSKLSMDKIKTLKLMVQSIHDKTDKDKAVISSEFFRTLGGLYTRGFTSSTKPEININRDAFEDFLKSHLTDPKYAGKYVVFVHGKFQKFGPDKIALIKEVYDKFGNIEMHVDKITSSKPLIVMDTPEFL